MIRQLQCAPLHAEINGEVDAHLQQYLVRAIAAFQQHFSWVYFHYHIFRQASL